MPIYVFALFNMLPILPLDGGRILKDVLVSKMGLVRGCKYTRRLSFDIFGFAFGSWNFSIYNK